MAYMTKRFCKRPLTDIIPNVQNAPKPYFLKKWLTVMAYKHDGEIHRLWSPAYVVEETPEYWALASRASLVREADGREWITKEHAVFYLFKHEWMNVISMFKESGICFYANIASPAILDKGIIKYIDYDLDLKLLPDGKEKVLDVEEYAQNAKSYGYDEDLMRAIKHSFRKTEELLEKRAFPFDEKEVLRLFSKFERETKPVIKPKEPPAK